MDITIEKFEAGSWQPIAVVTCEGTPIDGRRAKTRLQYEQAFAIDRRNEPAAGLSVRHPPKLHPENLSTMPGFLVDLVPQGYARKVLLEIVGSHGEEEGDWVLLQYGPHNPVGNLRVAQAAAWVGRRRQHTPKGFTLDGILSADETFINYHKETNLPVHGSSGLQGEWPKFAITLARDGLYYLDHELPDTEAVAHFIVKMRRGEPDSAYDRILQLEARYRELAECLGFRVAEEVSYGAGRSLLIRRFDRRVQGSEVTRIGQESLLSAAGLLHTTQMMRHEQALAVIRQYSTQQDDDIVDYLLRDALNICAGNRDNHACNTAFQRFDTGEVRLAPVFDFAPMHLHPDSMARVMTWGGEFGMGRPNWRQVLHDALSPALANRAHAALLSLLNDLPDVAEQCGLTEALAPFEHHRVAMLESL